MSENGAVPAAAPAAGVAAGASSNAFADINGKQFLQQPSAATAAPATAAASPTAAATAAPAAAAAIAAAKPYNPHANLQQLDASLSLPDESENARLASALSDNVATLMATKQANERKQLVVGSILAEKYKSMEEERGKLMLIRQELAKLDQSLSRNIDMLRAEIESVGREVNWRQQDFDVKERDYLTSRKALAKAKQRKLLLTSHLDLIIINNENEKAKKLTELEISLGLTPTSPAPRVEHKPPHSVPGTASAAAASAAQRAGGGAASPRAGASPAVIAAAAESAARLEAARAAAAIPADHPGLNLGVVAPPGFGGFEDEEGAGEAQLHPEVAAQLQQLPSLAAQQQQLQQQRQHSNGSADCTNPFGPPSPLTAAGTQQHQHQQQQPLSPSTPAQRQQQQHRAQQQQQQQQRSNASHVAAAAATARHVSLPPRNAAPAAAAPPAARAAQSTLSIAHRTSSSPHHYLPDGTFAGFSE